MNFIVRLLVGLFASFCVCVILLSLLIVFLKKQKIKQVILSYVDMHTSKSGTPTMGGIAFVLAICFVGGIMFFGDKSLGIMACIVTFSYGVIGFLDDFIKFKFKRNLGLLPYQKIVSQLLVAVAVAVFVYKSQGIAGGVINIPFTRASLNLGAWIIPFVVLIFLASTNSVNLTDGLDGLAGTTVMSFLATFGVLLAVMVGGRFSGAGTLAINEYKNLIVLCAVGVGAMLAFLLFNGYPAKIFMGDTGSLALGGLVASIAIFSQNSLFVPIIGAMFVASSVSVILQVAHFKRTRKRIFLMAPLHHHFEKKGVHEVKIVVWYSVITVLLGLACILGELLVFG